MKTSFENLSLQFDPLIKSQIQSLGVTGRYDEYYQVGLIGLWEAFKRFDQNKGDFGPFAYRTVRGKMLEQLKKEAKYKAVHVGFSLELTETIPFEGGVLPLENEVLEMYLSDLTLNQRKWVVKKIFLQMKEAEIAEEEGVSIHAVKSWRKQALLKLRSRAERHEIYQRK
ncbi:sigma-70 family RNA polymerase sigma factor [Fictibacillus sp. WQ 8-8]|uniref:sigma-70 family RNA polymerase sigma factor n=1 Tax=unclassified Fictibacillus TaxID=2644029 RepID=UPI00210A7FAB|nr:MULTISPECIES: sigma-70 family RNA polymerase sigma factor [unclassified Fictibacillus]MCQ6264824.1 sigma-70 family RNA polymerase sigma factor [Fictibacillus sp. WQ 8-8]UZJ79254.1 sigma-70 family RNA polymerase sigma factor [Fictibacillus sp. KU28468]